MARNIAAFYRTLAWTGALLLLVAMLGWTVLRLAQRQPVPVLPSFLSLFRAPTPTAAEISPSAEDLGEGWLLTAEKRDLEASYYFDFDSNGYPMIGTHVSVTESWVDKEQVQSVSMRGLAHPDQHWVLMSAVVVFKELAQAETTAREFFPKLGVDSDIPSERYTNENIHIGDEAKLVILQETPDEALSAITLAFRKGRVLVMLMTMSFPAEALSSPENVPVALSETKIIEIARLVESRIP